MNIAGDLLIVNLSILKTHSRLIEIQSHTCDTCVYVCGLEFSVKTFKAIHGHVNELFNS